MVGDYEPRKYPIGQRRARGTFLKAIEEQAVEVVTSLADEPFSVFQDAGLDQAFGEARERKRVELKQLYERFGESVKYMDLSLPSDSISIEWYQGLMSFWDRMWPSNAKPWGNAVIMVGVSAEMFEQMERVRVALERWAAPFYLKVNWMLRVGFETLCWWAQQEDGPDGRFVPLTINWRSDVFEPFSFRGHDPVTEDPSEYARQVKKALEHYLSSIEKQVEDSKNYVKPSKPRTAEQHAEWLVNYLVKNKKQRDIKATKSESTGTVSDAVRKFAALIDLPIPERRGRIS
jgi:hypothetical protein